MNDEPDMDLPDGWKAPTLRFSGNFRLIAEFEHEETGAEVRITPQKTYSQLGFANVHRIVYIHPEDGVEEVAVGIEVEKVEEAKAAAIEAMRRI